MTGFRRGLLWCGLCVVVGTGTLAAQARKVTYEQLTVEDTAVGITAAVLAPTSGQPIASCWARLETAEIRFRYDGTAPTSSVGTLLEVGDVLSIKRLDDATAIRFIRTTAVSGVLDIHCEPQS